MTITIQILFPSLSKGKIKSLRKNRREEEVQVTRRLNQDLKILNPQIDSLDIVYFLILLDYSQNNKKGFPTGSRTQVIGFKVRCLKPLDYWELLFISKFKK